jgi:hypothetical protein
VSTTTAAQPTFRLPDTLTSLPASAFAFTPAAREPAARVLAGPPAELFSRLLRDQESEVGLLVARRVLHGFLTGSGDAPATPATAVTARTVESAVTVDAVASAVSGARDDLAARVAALRSGPAERVEAVV